jgi:hypothetical protein
MIRARLVLSLSAAAAIAGCQCISPASLQGFACEANGQCGLDGYTCCADNVCRLDCSQARDGSTGSGDAGDDGGVSDSGTPACGPSTCDGCCDGVVCRTGATQSACGKAGEACGACDPVNQRCVAAACQTLSANGSTCTAGAECVSSFCTEGVCCDQQCGGACGTCKAAGSEGRCVAKSEGTAQASCAPFVCDGIKTDCPTACTSLRQCVSGRYCDASSGQCLVAKVSGASCGTGTECATGFCADGVCCDSPCSGSCDRCNGIATLGLCKPAASGDPGSPSCGTYTCNGALADCPIPCGVGCPVGTYCSGAYCAAQKVTGLPCTTTVECLGGLCVDGVCCDTACGGECDACSVAAGAPGNGTCTLLGAAKICRAATGLCDLEERCSSTSASCPTDGFAQAGGSCGTSVYGTWSVCTPPPTLACSVTGTQTRSRTDQTCDGLGACRPDAGTESGACSRVTEDTNCGTVTFGTYSSCNYVDATCSTSASRTRSRTEPMCKSGGCTPVASTETDTAGCARVTENDSCGTTSNGSWSSCSYADSCAQTGTRTRTNTSYACHLGGCPSHTSTETDYTTCTRVTTNDPCGAGVTYGSWGACSYADVCSTDGSRTQTVTTYTCSGGICGGADSTATDTSGCVRATDGTTCPSAYGGWGTCSYALTCSNAGSRTRAATPMSCGGGTCSVPGTPSTETDLVGCDRNTNGTVCGTGLECLAGTCVCNNTTGCAGCCSGNACKLGSQGAFCGSGGVACESCIDLGEICGGTVGNRYCYCNSPPCIIP